MDSLTLLYIFTVAFTGLTEGRGVLPDGPLKAPVGGNVMFTTTLDPTLMQSITWWTTNGGTIVTIHPTGIVIAPGYEDRITVFTSTGSLELRNVSLHDSEMYHVVIEKQSGELSLTGTTTLNVEVPVSNVEITTSSRDLIEFSSVRLSCSASGFSPSFRWFNGSSEVTAGHRVHITDGGSNLTIVTVTRYDQGPFRCHGSNLVSDATSDPVTFTISYNQGVGGSKCDTGCIIGIGFECLAIIFLVAVLVLVIVKRKYVMEGFSKVTSNRTVGEGQDSTAYSGSQCKEGEMKEWKERKEWKNQELNYVDVRFLQNINGGEVELGRQTGGSE